MAKDVVEKCSMIIEAGGGKVVSKPAAITPENMVIDYNHWVGTARMGNDKKTSVLNKYNQAHDVENIFVTDGAAWVSSGCQNPTLTMMAITVRACDYILREYSKKVA